jgi:hypothetical protein
MALARLLDSRCRGSRGERAGAACADRRREPGVEYETIIYEVEDRVATITLNRPSG